MFLAEDKNMPEVNQYDTITDALQAAKIRGFIHSFKIEDHIARCLETGEHIAPEDMEIVEYHRFEGVSNPDDMSVVYFIESKSGLKGVLIDAYGAYSDENIAAFIEKVQVEEGI